MVFFVLSFPYLNNDFVIIFGSCQFIKSGPPERVLGYVNMWNKIPVVSPPDT